MRCRGVDVVCLGGGGGRQADEEREKFSANEWEEPRVAATSKVKITV